MSYWKEQKHSDSFLAKKRFCFAFQRTVKLLPQKPLSPSLRGTNIFILVKTLQSKMFFLVPLPGVWTCIAVRAQRSRMSEFLEPLTLLGNKLVGRGIISILPLRGLHPHILASCFTDLHFPNT